MKKPARAPASPTTGVPFRSKLRPHEGNIRHWLKAGLTYREMAEKLRIEHKLAVHPDTINSYVLVRARGRQRAMLPPAVEDAPATPPPSPASRAVAGKARAKAGVQGSPPSHYEAARVDEL
jgi:hypothetical protein